MAQKITVFIFGMFLILGCEAKEKEFAPSLGAKEANEMLKKEMERQLCVKTCGDQKLLMLDSSYGCKCSEPLAHILTVCSKACNGKMKYAESGNCECLNPHEKPSRITNECTNPYGCNQKVISP